MNEQKSVNLFSEKYRVQVRTVKGVDILMRPLFANDNDAFREFMKSLSQRTIYYRFLSPIQKFSDEMLNQLVNVDHKTHIAIAAFQNESMPQEILGIVRMFIMDDFSSAEVSLVVTDPWQGKGIGAELFRQCIEIAKKNGVRKLWGYVLPENTQMLKLAKKMNFDVRREDGESEFLISCNF